MSPLPFLPNAQFLVIAAILGAVTSAFLSTVLTWSGRATVLVAGSSFALFVCPYLCEREDITSTAACGALLYFGGLVGEVVLRKLLLGVHSLAPGRVMDFFIVRGGGPPV